MKYNHIIQRRKKKKLSFKEEREKRKKKKGPNDHLFSANNYGKEIVTTK